MSSEGTTTPVSRRRGSRKALPAASLAVSLSLHALLLTLGAIVVYQTAVAPRPSGPAVMMSFDAPGQGAGAAASVGDAPERAPGEVRIVSGPREEPEHRQTVASLSLSGLSSTPATTALNDRPPAEAGDSASMFAIAGESTAGASPGSSGEPSVTFAGLGASTARSVVYAVDCSGPMVTSLPMVLSEVRRSVSRLSPTQKFGVVLFRGDADGPKIEGFAPVLVRATPSAQKRLAEWLDSAEPVGRSSPLAGLESALALHPDAVFLLSRAIDRSGGAVWEGGVHATMARLDELNPKMPDGRRAVLIQTIQFLDEDPTGTLQAIGTQHGAGVKGYRVLRNGEDISSK